MWLPSSLFVGKPLSLLASVFSGKNVLPGRVLGQGRSQGWWENFWCTSKSRFYMEQRGAALQLLHTSSQGNYQSGSLASSLIVPSWFMWQETNSVETQNCQICQCLTEADRDLLWGYRAASLLLSYKYNLGNASLIVDSLWSTIFSWQICNAAVMTALLVSQ